MNVCLSACLIVRDEEVSLPACLRSLAGVVDESIVVDTGSSDRTRAVAGQLGARVSDFPWCDDFAAARNESLRHATGEWLLWIDADERLDDADRAKLLALRAALPEGPAAYSMRQRSPSRSGEATTVVDQVRLFRRDPAVRWEYRVHEQLLPSLRRARYPVFATDIVIEHTGYEDPVHTRRKLLRNLRLLQLDIRERPDDAFVLFNLGWALLELGRDAEAVPLLQRSLERSQPADSIVPKLYALLAQAAGRRGRAAEALAWCQAGRGSHPDCAELAFLEGALFKQQGELAAAEQAWGRLVDGVRATAKDGTPAAAEGASAEEGVRFGSVLEGLSGRRARHELALLYHEQGRSEEAERQWRAALADEPGFVPAWRGLGELYLARQQWRELDQVIGELANGLHRPQDAGLLRARALLARRDFDAARTLLDEQILRDPGAVAPRVYLSHVHLQEAQAAADPRSPHWDAAEQALRTVVHLDPGKACSWRNLSLLLWHERQRPSEALAACRAGRFHCPGDPALRLLEERMQRPTSP